MRIGKKQIIKFRFGESDIRTIVFGNISQLAALTISLDGNTLSIVDNDGRATSFDIYVDGIYAANVANTAEQLAAPTISLDGNTLSIVDNDGNATSFDIYVDGVYAANVHKS